MWNFNNIYKMAEKIRFQSLTIEENKKNSAFTIKKNNDAKKYLKINKFYTNKKLVSA